MSVGGQQSHGPSIIYITINKLKASPATLVSHLAYTNEFKTHMRFEYRGYGMAAHPFVDRIRGSLLLSAR